MPAVEPNYDNYLFRYNYLDDPRGLPLLVVAVGRGRRRVRPLLEPHQDVLVLGHDHGAVDDLQLSGALRGLADHEPGEQPRNAHLDLREGVALAETGPNNRKWLYMDQRRPRFWRIYYFQQLFTTFLQFPACSLLAA